MPPTRSVTHALDRCPDCAYLRQGDHRDDTRAVLELPEPQPIEVIEQRIINRFCPHCRRWHAPALDLIGQVLGQGCSGGCMMTRNVGCTRTWSQAQWHASSSIWRW